MKQLPPALLPLSVSALMLVALLHANVSAFAQFEVGLTGPTAPVEVPEGDDFACNVLKNCWEMNELRDIAFEHYVRSARISNGIWTGENDAAEGPFIPPEFEPEFPAMLFPLYGAFPSVAGAVGDAPGLPRSGLEFPIDSSRYTYLSMRMNHTNRSLISIGWNSGTPGDSDATQSIGVKLDGAFVIENIVFNKGFHVYQFDMTNLDAAFDDFVGAWSGNINTLSIQPSAYGVSDGDVIELDWIRLVDPDSAPTHTITWTTFQDSTDAVIRVMMDTDDSDFDGHPIAIFPMNEDPQAFTFPTAMLPAGDYYFYIEIQQIDSSTGELIGEPIQSNYSPLLRINAAPKATFTSPTQLTGPEYAQTVRQDPWDMASAADIANLDLNLWPEESIRRFRSPEIRETAEAEEGGAVFTALTAAELNRDIDSEEDDLTGSGNPSAIVKLQTNPLRPIDPKFYRYLTYRMRAVGGGSQYQRLANGWFSSFSFGNLVSLDPLDIVPGSEVDDEILFELILELTSTLGATVPTPVYEGWNTYTIDLWDQNSRDPGGAAWQSMYRISQLQMAPLEAPPGTRFEIDWVRLNAENRPANNIFTVELLLEDPDSNALNVSLFYDTDNKGFDGTLITQLNNVTDRTISYSWDTSALPLDQEFYLYVTVSDGNSTTSTYAAVPVRTGTYQAAPPKFAPALDYDGDGISDTIVYRPYEGRYYQRRSTIGLVGIQWVVGDEYQPIQGDFDGDGRTDLALVFEFYGYLAWYIHNSSDNTVTAAIWGYPGDQIAVADYNGDGKDQIGVFRDGSWYYLDEAGGAHFVPWGVPGDIAVPRDYNGDGIDDIAVWRPEDGTWWVVYSGAPTGTPSTVVTVQWGLPGDIPVPADWSVVPDGRADYGVYRPSLGMWFFRDSKNDLSSYYQWGLPGHRPVVGDFDGDGYTDLTAHEEVTGNWYHFLRSRNVAIQQTGLPGDKIPLNHR